MNPVKPDTKQPKEMTKTFELFMKPFNKILFGPYNYIYNFFGIIF